MPTRKPSAKLLVGERHGDEGDDAEILTEERDDVPALRDAGQPD